MKKMRPAVKTGTDKSGAVKTGTVKTGAVKTVRNSSHFFPESHENWKSPQFGCELLLP